MNLSPTGAEHCLSAFSSNPPATRPWKPRPVMRRQIAAEKLNCLEKPEEILRMLPGGRAYDPMEGRAPIKQLARAHVECRIPTAASSALLLLRKLGGGADRFKALSFLAFSREILVNPSRRDKHKIKIIYNFTPSLKPPKPRLFGVRSCAQLSKIKMSGFCAKLSCSYCSERPLQR